MFNLRYLFWTLILLVGLSCDRKQSDAEPKYFNVQEFTKTQVQQLTPKPCKVVKTLTINGEQEQQEFVTTDDSSFWLDEFKVFLEHDINKPVLRDAYKVSQGTTDAGLPYITYVLNDPHQSGVVSMRIVYDSLSRVQWWESQYQEKNALYTNQRYVQMNMRCNPEGTYLQHYRIQGMHKLVLKDSVHYEMLATLEY